MSKDRVRGVGAALLWTSAALAAGCDPGAPRIDMLADGRYQLSLAEPELIVDGCFLRHGCTIEDWLMSEPVFELRKEASEVTVLSRGGTIVQALGEYREARPDRHTRLWQITLFRPGDPERRQWRVQGYEAAGCDAWAYHWFADRLCPTAVGPDPYYVCGRLENVVRLSCEISPLGP